MYHLMCSDFGTGCNFTQAEFNGFDDPRYVSRKNIILRVSSVPETVKVRAILQLFNLRYSVSIQELSHFFDRQFMR